MELKRGVNFRNIRGTKCYIANVFNEGDHKVVTYRYWLKHKQRWKFETEFKELFLIGFDYGWKWE